MKIICSKRWNRQSDENGTIKLSSSHLLDLHSALGTKINRAIMDVTANVRICKPFASASGGFADVYEAEYRPKEEAQEAQDGEWLIVQTSDVVKVAVKILRPDEGLSDARARKRLDRELTVWHRLRHSNIVQLLGKYHAQGRDGMVMPWFTNGNAKTYLQMHPQANRLKLIRDVAAGLAYLHGHQEVIVHGDLKATNVLIKDDGSAVLTDFGLSQFINAHLGRSYNSPTLAGSIHWLSPELAVRMGGSDDENDDDCSPIVRTLASDCWAFGCTALEIATGIPPYSKYRGLRVMKVISGGELPGDKRTFLRLGLPMELWDLLESCWSQSPSNRPQTHRLLSEIRRMESLHHVIPSYDSPIHSDIRTAVGLTQALIQG
ncbi:hypothetical protein JAAARDRAFT_210657 [Jaapia argillacea MUCL 33604]|uniref:Protein kinase domain-containing protein n=1 Tax=Jaapia argillacea MUCL 33604 TaxID=933084 RepID=A0A067PBF6_9AGAM|nr:hypothetical protein JAAARDRAFT_210657 [Jaapia argillacea MUCL 33604]